MLTTTLRAYDADWRTYAARQSSVAYANDILLPTLTMCPCCYSIGTAVERTLVCDNLYLTCSNCGELIGETESLSAWEEEAYYDEHDAVNSVWIYSNHKAFVLGAYFVISHLEKLQSTPLDNYLLGGGRLSFTAELVRLARARQDRLMDTFVALLPRLTRSQIESIVISYTNRSSEKTAFVTQGQNTFLNN